MASNITLNNTVSEYGTRLTVSLWYGVLSGLGIILLLPVLAVTIIQRHTKMTPFYIFQINLLVGSLCTLVIYLTFFVPCIAAAAQLYGTSVSTFYIFLGYIAFVIVQLNSFLISVNRCFMICKKSFHDNIFTLKFSKIFAVPTWFLSGFALFISEILGCSTVFVEKQFFYYTSHKNFSILLSVGSIVSYVCIYVVTLFYFIAIWYIWKGKQKIFTSNQQASNNMSKFQMNLFYQAICIWLTLLASAISTYAVNVLYVI